ncbi:MAG: hypothetical protein LBO04_04985 [Spirochaetaceae bacterium]|jgi:hypothetical protein|nr:hypothetical protein [Spirochaetaceae bacterium]
MKRFFVVFVLAMALCGSVFAQNTGPFSGFWVHKSDEGNLLFYFLGNTYRLMILEKSQTVSEGVFSVTNNQLKLYEITTYQNGAALFTYGNISEEAIMLSKDVNDTPLIGLWVKMNISEPPPEGVFSKLTGVWESSDKNIILFRIYPDGTGWCYQCSAGMVLEDCFKVKFTAPDAEKGKLFQASGAFADTWIELGDYRITGTKLIAGNREYVKRK